MKVSVFVRHGAIWKPCPELLQQHHIVQGLAFLETSIVAFGALAPAKASTNSKQVFMSLYILSHPCHLLLFFFLFILWKFPMKCFDKCAAPPHSFMFNPAFLTNIVLCPCFHFLNPSRPICASPILLYV